MLLPLTTNLTMLLEKRGLNSTFLNPKSSFLADSIFNLIDFYLMIICAISLSYLGVHFAAIFLWWFH